MSAGARGARVSPFITQRMKKRRAQNKGGHLISENGDLRPEYVSDRRIQIGSLLR
jgi:hypothetical protein